MDNSSISNCYSTENLLSDFSETHIRDNLDKLRHPSSMFEVMLENGWDFSYEEVRGSALFKGRSLKGAFALFPNYKDLLLNDLSIPANLIVESHEQGYSLEFLFDLIVANKSMGRTYSISTSNLEKMVSNYIALKTIDGFIKQLKRITTKQKRMSVIKLFFNMTYMRNSWDFIQPVCQALIDTISNWKLLEEFKGILYKQAYEYLPKSFQNLISNTKVNLPSYHNAGTYEILDQVYKNTDDALEAHNALLIRTSGVISDFTAYFDFCRKNLIKPSKVLLVKHIKSALDCRPSDFSYFQKELGDLYLSLALEHCDAPDLKTAIEGMGKHGNSIINNDLAAPHLKIQLDCEFRWLMSYVSTLEVDEIKALCNSNYSALIGALATDQPSIFLPNVTTRKISKLLVKMELGL